MKLTSKTLIAALLAGVVLHSAMAENYTWTGNGSQDLWTTAALWDPDGTPTGTDNVLGYSIAGTIPSGIAIRIAGNQSINNLTVENVSGNSANNTGVTFATQYTAATLNINGTLTSNNTGTGGGQKYVVFSDAGTPQSFTLNVGAVNAVQDLAFGNAQTSSTANKLSNLTVSGATTIANNKSLSVQSNNANFNGGVVLNGTGSGFYVAINRDTVNFSVSNHAVFGAKVSGLSGNGTVANAQAGSAAYNAYTDGTLVINGSSGTSTFSGNMVNGGSTAASYNTLFLVKNGSGTQVLSGTGSTFTGGTTVNAGTLLIANGSGSALGTGAVTVNGGNFGGTGIASNAVTVKSGATLLAGDGSTTAGGLTLSGAVSLEDGAIISLTLGASNAHSSLIRTGGLWAFDSNQLFTLINAQEGTYNNIIYGLTGSEAGISTINTWSISNGGLSATFTYDGLGGVDMSVVPEPSSAALLIGAFGVMGIVFRRGMRKLEIWK